MIMTTEPKFIPNDAVEITIREGLKMRVRLVDCVGYTCLLYTSTLNPPPTVKGRAAKILYATQIRIKPPTFLFFTNYPCLLYTS